MGYKIREIAKAVGAQVIGDGELEIKGVSGLDRPEPGTLVFIQDPKDLACLEKSAAGCIIVPKSVSQSQKPLLQTDNPKLAFAKALHLLFPPEQFSGSVSAKAAVASSAKIGKNVTIEAFAYVDENAEIGNDSVIRAFSFIGNSVRIGSHTLIHPNVNIYEKTVIGNRVTIHSGCVIGADGFGFVIDGKSQVKVPQVGNVVIQDEVEIGANTTIDRATIGQTVIGKGTKIDNQVQIAHNVQIGEHCAISAKCGISGSCKLGNFVILGGGAGLADHVEIGDGTMLGANSGVPSKKKIPAKQIWFGQPARPYQEMRKQIAAQLRAHENQEGLAALAKRLEQTVQDLESLKSSIKS